MKYRAIFILFTFVILFGINKISLAKDVKTQNESFSVINISGKQRMYSQNISKLALVFKNNNLENSPKNLAQLQKTTLNFTEAHQNLKNNYIAKYDDFYLNTLFDNLEIFYLRIVNNTNLLIKNKNNKELVEKYVKQIKFGANSFLPIMDEIVNHYEKIGKNKGEVILKRETTFNIIILFLSIYSVFFLIFPLINLKKK